MSLDICQKRVHLLKEMLPHMRTLAVLSNTGHPGEQSEHGATIGAAQRLGIRLVYVPFASADELEGALGRVLISQPDAMIVYPDGTTLVNRARIAEFAKSHGLPSMFGFTVYKSIEQASSSGKIPFPVKADKVAGGHAIDAVGYDDSIKIKNLAPDGVDTTGALLIRNSWGTGWGNGGYGWLPYEYVLQGLADDWWCLIKGEWIETGQFKA